MRLLVLFAVAVCVLSTCSDGFLLKKRLKKQKKGKGGGWSSGFVLAPLPPVHAAPAHFGPGHFDLHEAHLHHGFADPGHYSTLHVDVPAAPPPPPPPPAAPSIHGYIQQSPQGKYVIYCPYEVYGMEPVKGNIQPRW
ncbi:uncharacterized protein LOC135395442 [Ornithodoros turicata]|uniref:uncharacterized protein LOC135395442 n=1 Tax=Ornithodoros turicata TaxID=34597 RepID=UPI00313965E9